MIDPGGLLLVVPHVFACPSFIDWVAKKSKQLNLDVKNIFAESRILSIIARDAHLCIPN
jgi:hypothetical protein